ncbi:ABC transporter permease [Parapedobacter koreensis]|uniref:FtsX-like permease family protein n=1 Tax=Parapedobacter koreensis TaxID=332977 RepID=A0A1H7R1L8_9SPHI|nr:ABC transporter permease [Parapedobacter koreensis]SEL53805.1 FtsX-like permease family protein [Parapedobacter koreensis]
MMIYNHIKTAFRGLGNSRFYSTVNIIGLTTGLAVGILILLWVQNELSYDRFHGDKKNIYRLLSNVGTGSDRQVWGSSHAPISTFAQQEIPEVRNAARVKGNFEFSLFSYADKEFKEESTGYADPALFSIFDFTWRYGNPKAPFADHHSVVLTVSTAERYFGSENPMGKVLRADNSDLFVVTGVVEDFPENSSIRYDMLFPMALYAEIYAQGEEGRSIESDFGNFTYTTFLQLHAGISPALVERKLAQSLLNHYKDIGLKDPYALQPLAKMHLYNPDGSEGMMQVVRIFLIVGILILVISAINYVNLSTARSMLRVREVSMRKILGARKSELFIQFMAETAITFIIAGLGACLLVYVSIPVYSGIAGKSIAFQLSDPRIWGIAIAAIGFTLILSGIYPALLLSSFEPLKAIKGKIAIGLDTEFIRKVLVVTQFVASLTLVTGTIVIDRQLHYIHEKELGFDKAHVLTFDMRDMAPHTQSIKNELLKQRGITGITTADDPIINIGTNTTGVDWEGKASDRVFYIHPLSVDEDFVSVLGLQLAEGQGFSGIATDSIHYVLNETAIREAGISDPIGKRFNLWGKEGTIIGIVKDFHFASMKQQIEPVVLRYQPQENYKMYVKVSGRNAANAIALVETLWKQYNAGFPFEYTFLDDAYDSLYKAEQRSGMLFKLFSLVAILLSCLGLFGLSTYMAQVKVREVGIRKVLGASVADVVRLLSSDFVRLVLIAAAIASPITWWAMSQWLEDFAYRIDIQWWMFAVAGLMAVVIALLTVGGQAIRAAMANPVESLRDE